MSPLPPRNLKRDVRVMQGHMRIMEKKMETIGILEVTVDG